MTKQEIIELSKNEKVIIDFHADWCGGCQDIKPIIKGLDEAHSDVKVIYINVDEHDKDQLKKDFGIKAIPNVQLWENGKKRTFSVGVDIGKITKMFQN